MTMEQTARVVRISIPAAAFALAVHSLVVGDGKTAVVLSFGMASFYLLPSPRIAEQLRQNPYVVRGLLLIGLVQIDVGLLGLRAPAPSLSGLVLLGIALVLSSCGHLLHGKAARDAKLSVARLVLCLTSVAASAVWLWLELVAS